MAFVIVMISFSLSAVAEDDLSQLEILAEQGNPYAQNDLGVMYEGGERVAQDYEKAVFWYQRAAEQGYDVAQSNLGNMYDRGDGVAQDYEEAVFWWRKAAEQGYAQAQYNLGVMYAVCHW